MLSHRSSERNQPCVHLDRGYATSKSKLSLSLLNVTGNKKQPIKLIVERLCAMQSPLDTDVVITGSDAQPVHMGSGVKEPPLHHEEADVLMVSHFINEASVGHTNIKVISDDTDVSSF